MSTNSGFETTTWRYLNAALFAAVFAGVAYVGTGVWSIGNAALSGPPTGRVSFAAGAIVRDGPFYEVRNVDEDARQSIALGHRYDFQPIRFKEHRGKWLVLYFLPLASGDLHNDQGEVANYKYARELRKLLKGMPEHEFWVVRMNRAPHGMPITGNFRECSRSVTSKPQAGPNACFDRFVYGAYHRGGRDGLYYKPQMKWLADMRLLSNDPLWMNTDMPTVMAIGPDGRMFNAAAVGDGSMDFSRGARATATALATLARKE